VTTLARAAACGLIVGSIGCTRPAPSCDEVPLETLAVRLIGQVPLDSLCQGRCADVYLHPVVANDLDAGFLTRGAPAETLAVIERIGNDGSPSARRVVLSSFRPDSLSTGVMGMAVFVPQVPGGAKSALDVVVWFGHVPSWPTYPVISSAPVSCTEGDWSLGPLAPFLEP